MSRVSIAGYDVPNRGPGRCPPPFTAEDEFALEPTIGNYNQVLGVVGGKFNIARTFLLNVSLLFPHDRRRSEAQADARRGF